MRLVNTLYSLNEATRLASVMGLAGASGGMVSSASAASSGQVLLRSRSGPLEQSRTPHVETFKPRSGQLDPSRVRAGYLEPHRQVTGLIETHRPKSPQTHKSAGLPDYLRHLPGQQHDQRRGSSSSSTAEPSRAGSSFEGGREIPWQSSSRSLQFSGDRDGAHVDSRSEAEPSNKPLGGTGAESSRAPHADQSWHGARTANGFAEPGHHVEVQPLLSLLEKEPPSRPGQTDFYRHGSSSSFDRHDSSLPMLHHAAAIRKMNGKMDAPGSGYGGGTHSPATVSPTQSTQLNRSHHGVASSSSHSDASPSGVVSQRDSGQLSTSGAPNGRSSSGSSPVLLSRMVSTLNADVIRDYVVKVADLLLEFSRADTVVKSHMCSVNLLIRLFQMLNKLEPVILLKVSNSP